MTYKSVKFFKSEKIPTGRLVRAVPVTYLGWIRAAFGQRYGRLSLSVDNTAGQGAVLQTSSMNELTAIEHHRTPNEKTKISR
jgi:hypothetical protein